MPEFAAPRVSVIVPAYNLETLLPRCLDSLLAQTFARWECVVVDDGSADGTGAVADAYAAKNPRFVVIHQQNGGVSAARNAGIEAARAPDLLFLDGDDALEPWAIDWCVATQDRFPDDLIGFHMRGAGDPADTPPDGSEQPRVFTAAQKQAYMAGNFGGNVTIKVFSADVIRQDKVAFDPALARGEDQDFCFRYLDAFFARRPGAAVRQYGLHLYVVYTDNGAGRASSQKVAAHAIDWDAFEREYSGHFGRAGKVAIPARVAFGCLIVRAACGVSDRETVFLIRESPYLQYFLGFDTFTDDVPFSPRSMERFRARIPAAQVRRAVRLLRSFEAGADGDTD